MNPVIRISDADYLRLKQLAEPFEDTPGSVVSRLLDEHHSHLSPDRRNEMVMNAQAELNLAPGYLLFAQPEWIEHHQRSSIGGTAYYCRGAGGPMRNVAPGGHVFCARRGTKPHRLELRGQFAGWEVAGIDDAWDRYGPALGAPSKRQWVQILRDIDSVRNARKIGLIRLENVVAISPATIATDAGVEVQRGAMKGRSLKDMEVDRLMELE